MSWRQPISAISAELNAAGLCRRESSLGSCSDHLSFVLGNRCENMQRQACRMRAVDGDELDAGIHQRGDEGQISREAINARLYLPLAPRDHKVAPRAQFWTGPIPDRSR